VPYPLRRTVIARSGIGARAVRDGVRGVLDRTDRRVLHAAALVLVHRAGVARLQERFGRRGQPGLDLAAALELGVELRAEEDRDVRQPEPDEEGDDAAERSVGLVVGGEV